MTLTEKVAYIRGLMEGLDVDKDDKEMKIISAVVDLLDDMALSVCDLEDSQAELEEYVEELDEDLGALEEDIYEDECEGDCDCGCCDDDCDCDDGFNYKTECPVCGEDVLLDDEILRDGAFECPHCGETIDFGEDIEEDECDCGCCDAE